MEIAPRDDLAVSVSPTPLPGGYADPRTDAIGWRAMGEAAGEAEGYDAARIALGLPDLEADISSGAFFPHEANMDQLGGVNFKKGCYIGQEVVSRMEHRGTARSRILPVTLPWRKPRQGHGDPRGREADRHAALLLSGQTALALIRLDRLAEAVSKTSLIETLYF